MLICTGKLNLHFITIVNFSTNSTTPVCNLRTLPQDDGQVSTEKQVQDVPRFIRNLVAESFPDDHVPERAEFFVHQLLDRLGRVLFIFGDFIRMFFCTKIITK